MLGGTHGGQLGAVHEEAVLQLRSGKAIELLQPFVQAVEEHKLGPQEFGLDPNRIKSVVAAVLGNVEKVDLLGPLCEEALRMSVVSALVASPQGPSINVRVRVSYHPEAGASGELASAANGEGNVSASGEAATGLGSLGQR